MLVILKDAGTFTPFDYHTYETLDELVTSGVFKRIPNRWQLEQAIGEALVHKWATWID